MKLILIYLFLGNFQLTAYRSVPEQTDNSPHHTATGELCHPYGVAVSQDLLRKNGGPLEYGDWIYIQDIGLKVVNDTMNARHKHAIDVWVETLAHEQKFFKRFRNGKRLVFKVRLKMVSK